MNFTDLITLVASLGGGIFFGALISKLVITKSENNLHYIIYGFSIVVILGVIFIYIIRFNEFYEPFNWYAHIISFIALLFAVMMLIFTRKYLVPKSIFSVPELDPIINKFTEMADRNEIRLFGGDLNFFGNSPLDMDRNNQYNLLKALNFNRVLILCETPNDAATMIRYGKLYYELNHLELRFYHPERADLRVRGRIISVNGSSKLIMYTKYSQGRYQALETDTANSSGALYNNIWDLAWSMANQPEENDVKNYIGKYRNKI